MLKASYITLAFLTLSLVTQGSEPENKQDTKNSDKKEKRISRCKTALAHSLSAVVGAYLGLLITDHTTMDDTKAFIMGKKHVGFGIYLDKAELLKSLSFDESALFQNPEKNKHKIASLLTAKLNGDYDEGLKKASDNYILQKKIENFKGRSATTFFDNEKCSTTMRGVCRHKASILHSILKEFGINAQLKKGGITKQFGEDVVYHAWVTLDDTVYDPTFNEGGVIALEKEYISSLGIIDVVEVSLKDLYKDYESIPIE